MGFRKIDPDKWEFANEEFSRGQRHLLRNIRRRKSPSQFSPPQHQALGPCLELGSFGVDGELGRLRRDKQVLTMELVKLRQRQQNTRAQLQAMEIKLQGTERKQQQMMTFLARAMQNPEFIKQLVQQKEKRKELEDAINKKRPRTIDQGEPTQGSQGFNLVKAEPFEFEDLCGYKVSELEALALEMQGFGKARKEQYEDIDLFDGGDTDIDDGFWEELLYEKINEESGFIGDEVGDEDDANVLASRLDHLGSSPN